MELDMILRATIALAIIFFLPGFVTFKAFKVNRIENLKLSLFETLFLNVLASIVITGWIAITLAALGYFSLMNLVGLLLVYVIIIAIKFRVKFKLSSFPKPKLNIQSVFLVLLVILAVILFFRPFEDIFGFDDGYLNVNIGVIIAKHGSIVFHDPLINSVPEDVAKTFYFKPNQQFNRLSITNYSTGEIQPGGLHLYPVWISIFYLIFGLEGSLYIAPIFGLLATIGVFLAAKHSFNWKVAAIASSILTMSYLQIWFSRSHSVEIMLQFIIFSGIFGFVLFTQSKNRFFGIVSALCFGLALMTGIEATLIIIPIVSYFTYLNIFDRLERNHFYFFIPFLFALLFAFVYYATIALGYVKGSFFAGDIPQIQLLAFAGVPIAINILPKNILHKIKTLIVGQKRKLQHIFTLLIVAYIIYSILTLPTTSVGFHGRNLIMLSWYLTSFVLILGFVGLIWMIYKKPSATTYFFLGITIVFFLFFIPNIHHGTGGPWWMRRYIFVVVPTLYIGVGYCIHRLTEIFPHWNGRKIIFPLLIIYLTVSALTISYPIINHIENKGVIQQTEKIFGSFGDDSVLLFADGSYPHIAYPLRHIYDKNTLLLLRNYWGVIAEPKDPEDADIIMQAYTVWSEAGKKIYIVNPSSKFIQAFEGNLTFTLYKKEEIRVPHLGINSYEFPTNFGYIVRKMEIYEISSK